MAVDVKICGLTRVVDVQLAVSHGAARLGIIFAGGPRVRTVPQAAALVEAAGAVPVMGVFGEQSVGEILRIVEAAGLRGAQLHGRPDATAAAQLRGAGLEVWQVLRVPGADVSELQQTAAASDLVLLEPSLPGEKAAAGGRGVPIDLDAARKVRLALDGGVRVGLAGGLTPELLAEAIRVVKPDLADVSSGVESSPGIKDGTRLIRFLEIARDTDPSA